LGGIIVALLLQTKMKEGVINGGLVGLISGLMVISIITMSAFILTPGLNFGQLLTMDFLIYIFITSIFQIMTGALGGTIGSLITHYYH
jgi:hypothetical protein